MFEVKINGETVKSIDIDPIMVQAVTVNGQRIPVQTEEVFIDLQFEFRSLRDGELIEKIKREGLDTLVDEATGDHEDKIRAIVEEQNTRAQGETEEDENGSVGTDLDHSDTGSDSGNSEGFQSNLEQVPYNNEEEVPSESPFE